MPNVNTLGTRALQRQAVCNWSTKERINWKVRLPKYFFSAFNSKLYI